jgi:TatA/E family protein of Tat protein translocase
MNLGMPEMIFIFLLALVVFGPRKLPELGRQLGKALAEFKRASNEFKNQLEVEMMNIELEERAKKPLLPATLDSDAGRTILPVEKLFETNSGPPVGSVSRGLPEDISAPLPEPLNPVESISSPPENDNHHPASPNA